MSMPSHQTARESELKCRRMILTLAALLADEDTPRQLTAGGFQRALGRAGLLSARGFIEAVCAEYAAAGLLRAISGLPGESASFRITAKGETQLMLMGEGIEHTVRWIEERTAETLQRKYGSAGLPFDDLARRTEVYERGGLPVAAADSPAAGEEQAEVSLTARALDAWWESLSINTKADLLTEHYERSDETPGKAVA